MEHYCSLQISQLLKKVGFAQNTRSFYELRNDGKWRHYDCTSPSKCWTYEISRPTHAEAIEWLRKHKRVLINTPLCIPNYRDLFKSRNRDTFSAFIEYYDKGYDSIILPLKGGRRKAVGYQTPFKATEAALKYVLRNLLKN